MTQGLRFREFNWVPFKPYYSTLGSILGPPPLAETTNPDPLKDPKMEPPNNPQFPHVVISSFWGGPFFGSCQGSGNLG